MITVTSVINTCASTPSQWEGYTDDGKCVYVRFRYGYLQVGVGLTPDDAMDDESVFGAQVSDRWDGTMDYDELKGHTAGLVTWP